MTSFIQRSRSALTLVVGIYLSSLGLAQTPAAQTPPAQAPLAQTPEMLKNGSPFFGQQDESLPRNLLILSFQGGPAVLSPAHQGAISILEEALKEGPSTQPLSEFKQELFNLGGQIDYMAEPNVFSVVVKSPPGEQEKVLTLLKKTFENPKINEADFRRLHGNVLASLRTGFEDMRQVLFYFAPKDFTGYSLQSRTGDTSPASLIKLSHKDFKSAFAKVINFERLFVAYTGPTDPAQVKKQVESVFANSLQKKYLPWKVEKQTLPKLTKSRYTLIDKPGATDNQIAFLYPQTVLRDQPEWALGKVTMDTLGGGLHGKLGNTLRTQRGLTYTAMSWYSSTTLPFWMVWTFGGLEQTKPLLTGVPEVVQQFVTSELTASELEESKSRLLNEFKTANELPKDRLNQIAWFYANGLNEKNTERFPADLAALQLKDVNQFRSSLKSKVAAVYIMGDRAKVIPMLEATGVKKSEIRILKLSDIR